MNTTKLTRSLILSTALATGMVAGASIANASEMTESIVEDKLATHAMHVEVDSLTDEQVSELYLITTSTDSHGEQRNKIMGVLTDWNVEYEMTDDDMIAVSVPRNQLLATVDSSRTELGLEEVKLSALSNEDLSSLYLIAAGSENASTKQQKAQAIIN